MKEQVWNLPNVYRVGKITRHGGWVQNIWLNDITIVTGVISKDI